MNITNYPLFVEISAHHKPLIENITSGILPYCDFIFSNLYIWEVDEFKTQISILNNNLIIKSKNIHTHNIEISLIGKTKLKETAEVLLRDHGEIRLVPQQILEHVVPANAIFIEDFDNHDYILSTQAISELQGQTFLSKRKRINKFIREFPGHKIKLLNDYTKPAIQAIISEIYKKWEISKNGNVSNSHIKTEIKAIENFINILEIQNTEIWGLEINEDFKAFTTIEYVNEDYAVSSFAKADLSYHDSNTYLTYKTSKYLFEERKIKYINHEQDLGLLNLRVEKLSWKPTHLLKKYIIKKL